MNYLDYLLPGGTIQVKNTDGSNYGSEIQSTNLRNFWEYIKLITLKIKLLNEINNKLEEMAPENSKTSPNIPKWNIRKYFSNSTDPGYLSFYGTFGNTNVSSSSNSI